SSKESDVATTKLNVLPEAVQEVKKLFESTATVILKRVKMTERKKENQTNNVDRTSCKRKLENSEELAVKKEETTSETGDLLNPTPLPHISLKRIKAIEIELVYTIEEDISFEFAEPGVSTSTRSVCGESEKADALGTPNGRALPQLDIQLQKTLQEASSCYGQENYTAAVEQFSAALELCSKGVAVVNPFKASPEDISSIVSFIEAKLVACYLKLGKPDDALNHSHRSIILNPAYFRNHLRQAAVFRRLKRHTEAARSSMIADYMYWLTGGTEQRISKLIKLYWQSMIEEAITREEFFSVMYTPFVGKLKTDTINKIKDIFAKNHPDYVKHIYTVPHGHHFLPQTAEWSSPQKHWLTLGFRNKHIGKTLERWSNRKLPIFTDRKAPFSLLTEEETQKYWDNTGKRIVPVMDFISSTKLTDEHCVCSRGIEKLHYASLLSRLQRVKEQTQVINQAMAELATIPYLQDISQQDAELLQSLMADAMDILEGRSDKGRVWNQIQKV
ncbi:Spermatogenesis-associated protein 16, partial [Mesitornis unicolor]